MYFIRKKDLKIVGYAPIDMVQFQMEDYYEGQKIIIKQQLEQKLN